MHSHDARLCSVAWSIHRSPLSPLARKKYAPWRSNAWCVKLFETADRTHLLLYVAKGDTSTYNNLQKFTHSIPQKLQQFSLQLYSVLFYLKEQYKSDKNLQLSAQGFIVI